VLSVAEDYVRLSVDKNEPFDAVAESIRSLFQICRLNALRAGIVVSHQDPLDWRSSLRVAIRASAARGSLPAMRLALVVYDAEPETCRQVQDVAEEAGLECAIFADEALALAWMARGNLSLVGA
jgi:hypothetical protein